MAVTINGTTGIETNTDTGKVKVGTSDDLQIHHTSGNSFIENSTGVLVLQGNGSGQSIKINPKSGENSIVCVADGETNLYYDNVKTFATDSVGCKVIGGEAGVAEIGLQADEGDDNADRWRIQVADGGPFTVGNKTSGAWETNIEANGNGNVELYYDNSKKFETTSSGVTVTGILSSSQTSGQGISLGDNVRLDLGAGDDLKIYHASDNTTIQNNTGNLNIINEANDRINLGAGGNWRNFIDPDGGFLPYVDNTYDLGQSNLRFDDIWATNDNIETSDRNKKENIAVSDLGLSFVNKLKPVSFKRKGKTRTHYGLIAQDIETLLSDISKSTTDFAGFIKTDSKEILYSEGEEEGKKAGDVRIPASTDYGLRYGEFISPLIKAVQELSAKVEALEAKVG